jgi:hypothetical protein
MKIKLEKSEIEGWLKSIVPADFIKGHEIVSVDSLYNGLEIEFQPREPELIDIETGEVK